MPNTSEEFYEEGKKHFEEGKWQEAINCFIETLRQDATHTDAITKLQWAQKQQNLEALYAQGEQHLADRNWLGAIEAFSEVVNLDHSYRNAQEKLKQAKQSGDLETLYKDGLRYFDEKEWQKAISALEKVEQEDAGYEVSAQLEEAKKRKRVKDFYEEGIAHMRKKEWAEALDKLDEVHGLDSEYRDVVANRKKASEQKEQQVRLSELYGKATGRERVGEWEEAKKTYLEILSIDATYEDVTTRVRDVGIRIKEKEASGETKQQGPNSSWSSFLKWWHRLGPAAQVVLLAGLIAALATICGAVISALPPLIESILSGSLAPKTSTPTATLTPLPTETLTPTVVSSPTHTPTITATSTSSPTVTLPSTSYPAPALVSPDEGTSFPEGQDVKLQWEWKQDLADDEFFEVRIRLSGEQRFDQIARTQLSYEFVPASELTEAGMYEWQVAIVLLSGEEKGVSRTWSFEVQ